MPHLDTTNTGYRHTFKSFNALKIHLSRWQSQKDLWKVKETAFHCKPCDFMNLAEELIFFKLIYIHIIATGFCPSRDGNL